MDITTLMTTIVLAGVVSLVTGIPTPRFVDLQNPHIHANTGQTIVLHCEVLATSGEPIEWYYVDHKQQISRNGQILVHDSRFSIIRPLGDAENQWNLEISNLMHHDQGSYACRIRLRDNTLKEQITHLTIADAPVVEVPAPEDLPAVNFTSCCLRQGVSSSCLPACSPSTLDLNTFNPVEACALDLLKLLHCGSDGRNHVACCRRRMVPNACFGFCVNDPPQSLDPSLQQCLDSSTQITACFEEGQHLLPTAPMMLTGEAISSSQIFVKWEAPAENGASVTAFKIFYQRDGDTGFSSGPAIRSTDFFFTLSGLDASTKYNIYVISINQHGASQPTYIIRVITQSSQPLPPGTDEQQLSDCCLARGVTGLCNDFLCSGKSPTASQEDKLQCYTKIDHVLSCVAGERNHTDCCMRMGLPQKCYKLCGGQVTGLDYEQMECFAFMGQIGSCFMEGKDTVPGVPQDIRMFRVSASQAVVEWDPPKKNADQLTAYLLRYKETTATVYSEMTVTKDSTRAILAQLKPSSLYETQVISVGAQGTSVPSTTAIFLTYMPDGGVLPFSTTTAAVATTPKPHDVMECCVSMGVKSECRQFCSYDVSFSNVETSDILNCENDLGKLLSCGADGRNHTACCVKEGVPDLCWPFCAFTPEKARTFTFEWDYLQCLPTIGNIINCMKEGTGVFPSIPRDLQVTNTTSHTISLMWRPPLRTGSEAVSYEVAYRLTDQDQTAWTTINATRTEMILQSLQSDTSYTVRVVALNSAGYSIYAPEINTRTSAEKMLVNLTAPTDLTDCCRKLGVSSACFGACDGRSGLINMHQCSSEMGKIIQCARDDRDHKPCCRRRNVPEHCQGFCDGTMEVNDFTSLLCLSVSQQIFTCFREGYEKLPSKPFNFHVYNISSTFVDLRWQTPTRNADGVDYDLFFKQMFRETYSYKENVKSPLKFDGLKPSTHYSFYLVARNSYGSSPPSSTYSVWTTNEAVPEIEIVQNPPNPVKLNVRVMMTCRGRGEPPPQLYWMRKGSRVNGPEYVIDTVEKDDVGTYTCVANSSTGQSVKDQYLKIEFPLEVMPRESVVAVEPRKALTAHLQCDFRGTPTYIEWFRNEMLLLQGSEQTSRYMWARHVRQDEGVVEAHMSILAVGPEDYAAYRCHGKNSLSENQAIIKLIDPSLGPGVTHGPTIPPAPAVLNVTACCIKKQVRKYCLDVCSFDVDIDVLVSKPTCLPEASKMVECAADGRNHSQCCERESVPAECMQFCSGNVPSELTEEHFVCLTHVATILQCMETGHDNIPGAPRNVKAYVVEGGIQVWWDSPATYPDKVQFYDVHYYDNKDPYIFPHTTHRVTLSSIHAHTTYNIYVVARNHHGSSHKSQVITVTVDAMYPSEPLNLTGSVIDGTSIHLRWNPPATDPGFVLFYTVYYAPVGEQNMLKVNTAKGKQTYLLEDLDANTRWSLYVTSHGSHHESGKSNIITIETGEKTITSGQTGQKKKGGGSNGVAIGLGVFFGLLIVGLAVAAFAFWYLRMRKVPHSRFKDSVSFENPGYATMGEPQVVSGIPGEPRLNLQDQQPSNGRPPTMNTTNVDSSIMKEVGDSGSDQGYATLNYPPSNGDVAKENPYATIGVTQCDPVDAAKVNISVGENVGDSKS